MVQSYSEEKGKSSSTISLKRVPPWMRYKSKEVEKLIIKLAKRGEPPSQIGMILRDVYGIHDVQAITKKKITKILKENNLLKEIPEDLMALIKKFLAIKKHLEKNKQDKTAKRGFQLTESKIKGLVKYYKKIKRLPRAWKFEAEKAKIYVD